LDSHKLRSLRIRSTHSQYDSSMTVPHTDQHAQALAAQQVVLAPMEGVINASMREFMTSMGGYSRCVTEFVRVTNVLLPERVFYRLCPELKAGGVTPSGVPVFVQLLGSEPVPIADNAARAAELGAPGVDLNFGCPAKTVNSSMGGSILLREPARVGSIVAEVRRTLPESVPLTVKIRLGYDNADALPEIVDAVRSAGANELAVHARTKFNGYKPPAFWQDVKPVMVNADPLVPTRINGEIWTVADARQACDDSGCSTVMLGRGALAAPDLAHRIASNDDELPPMEWSQLLPFIATQFERFDAQNPRYVGNRTKQWLAYLKRTYPDAAELFSRIRTLHDPAAIAAQFRLEQPSEEPASRLVSSRDSNLTESSDMSRKVLANLPSQASAHSR